MNRRTRELSIGPETRLAVYMRDGCCCVYCGSPNARAEAHFIPRSHGGLGIEKNILTLCRPCHDRFDHSTDREEMKAFFAAYLKEQYPDWDESALIYRKKGTKC